MKPIQDDELERALARHPLKGPREGLRDRVLATSREAWSRSIPIQSAGRFQISWAFSVWLAIAATVIFLVNLGVDSLNRNAVQAQFVSDTQGDAISHVAAVKAFADALRQQKQNIEGSGFFYR